MSVISTTEPIPPQGDTPAITPLSVYGSTSLQIAPSNLMPVDNGIFNQTRGIYLGNFSVNLSNQFQNTVFSWRFLQPLVLNGVSYYSPNLKADGTTFVPSAWELNMSDFAMMGAVEFELELIPVKVSDARFSFDIFFAYDNDALTSSVPQLYSNDSVHVIFDPENGVKRIPVPSFWLRDFVNNRSMAFYNGTTTTKKEDPFIPKTRIHTRVRQPYQSNLTQPDEFDVMVVLHPKFRNLMVPIGISRVPIPN